MQKVAHSTAVTQRTHTVSNSKTSNSNNSATDRVNLIQKGARNFLSKIKTSLSADSKWTLEIVCLNEFPIPASKTDSISQQAKKYLQYQLCQKAEQINHDRINWVKMMKN